MIEKNKLKFVVVSPRQGAGGPIVLHTLCRLLTQCGYEAEIFRPYGLRFSHNRYWIWLMAHWCGLIKDEFKALVKRILGKRLLDYLHISYNGVLYEPVPGCKRKWWPSVDERTIVVYPEIIRGNPLRAKNVVRWLLYYYKFLNDPLAYDSRDLFIAYRAQFDCPQINPNKYIVQVNYFDNNLYRQTNFEERQGCCYVIRKGKSRKDLPIIFDGPIIDNWSDEMKVHAFNKYKICYFYDTQTMYTSIAAVCGCIPVIVMEEGCTIDSYRKGNDPRMGVAYGEDDIPRAIATRKALFDYLNFDQKNQKAIEKFLEIINSRFGLKEAK